jgi:metal-responsive CopG/Arc/MetJ family transcriptional regulator
MLRTQVYLPEDLRQEIDAVARKEKKPAAKVIRELLIEGINKKHKETAGMALSRLTALTVKGGPKDLSINLDTYLYE